MVMSSEIKPELKIGYISEITPGKVNMEYKLHYLIALRILDYRFTYDMIIKKNFLGFTGRVLKITLIHPCPLFRYIFTYICRNRISM